MASKCSVCDYSIGWLARSPMMCSDCFDELEAQKAKATPEVGSISHCLRCTGGDFTLVRVSATMFAQISEEFRPDVFALVCRKCGFTEWRIPNIAKIPTSPESGIFHIRALASDAPYR
jgi:predicted nucleic-acid-binding Zn-ribbon protein